MNISDKSGFTLIELLVVVLIIGVLAAIAFPQYEAAVERTRAAEAISITKTIALANERYRLATGNYAAEISQLDIDIPGTLRNENRIETKHFLYTASASLPQNFLVISHRLPAWYTYYFYIAPGSTRIHCSAYAAASDMQKKLCTKVESEGSL